MKADAKTEAAVMAAMKKLSDAYAKRDVKAVLATLVPDPDLVILGTGADEKCLGPEQAKKQVERDFAQSQSSSMEIGWHTVSAEGPVAWVTADAAFHAVVARKKVKLPVRLTAVLVHRGRKWLIAQQHASMAAGGQEAGKSWPTK
jgi:ketosteroid isomerase-like protein